MTPTIHAIAGATVLSGPDLVPLVGATVVVKDEKIVTVRPTRETVLPEHADVVDATGATLLPGFIDAHVHIGFYEPRDVLAGGVTTVRDLGWPPELIARVVGESQSPLFVGPLVIAAGPMLTAPGGYPTRAAWAPEGTGLEISRPEHARAAVAAVADAGFCIVKVALNPPVGPVLDAQTLAAIVDAAHDRALEVTGHIYGLGELDKALDAGVDELAHMLMSDETIPPATIERMVASGVRVVPTLSVFNGGALDTAIANLSSFLAAGGRVIYGTDLGNEGPRPGIDAREVDAMTRAGMSGRAIIRSATVDSARSLGLGSTGVIEEGLDADLVLVEGDPLNDASVLTKVVAVWRKGRLLDRPI